MDMFSITFMRAIFPLCFRPITSRWHTCTFIRDPAQLVRCAFCGRQATRAYIALLIWVGNEHVQPTVVAYNLIAGIAGLRCHPDAKFIYEPSAQVRGVEHHAKRNGADDKIYHP
ncbi:MAG: hypothetical protein QF662_02750 [Phycisphaerae bacterium]|nr:hypothetical protein [Phycisphaerae bacterium]